jgi:hypothetical protein
VEVFLTAPENMKSPNPVPSVRAWFSSGSWSMAWLLALISFVWLLVPALRTPGYILDERSFGLPTIALLRGGAWPLHPANEAYGFPIVYYIAALIESFANAHPICLRLPNIVLGSLAVAIAFRWTAQRIESRVALLAGLAFACPNALHLTFVSVGSDYGSGLLCIWILSWTWWSLSGRAPIRRFAVVGAITGLILFVITQSRLLIAAWLIVVLWPHLARLVQRRSMLAACGGLCAIILSPAAYHYLTRRVAYVPPAWAILCLAAGGGGTAIVAARLWLHEPVWRAWIRRLATLGVVSVIVAAVPEVIYTVYQLPTLGQYGHHDATNYTLRHLHEWPHQVGFFFDRILPLVFIGDASQFSYTLVEKVPVRAAGVALGVGLAALWVFGAVDLARATPKGRAKRAIAWLLAPTVVAAVALVPSWNLANSLNARYFTLTLPGLFVPLCWLSFRYLGKPWRFLVFACFLTWCAYDGWGLWPRIWSS